MAKFTVTDPATNRSVDLEGDSPPSEQELNQIFSQVHGDSGQQTQDGGILHNAWEDVKGAGKGLAALPGQFNDTMNQMAFQNKDFEQTPIGSSLNQAAPHMQDGKLDPGSFLRTAGQYIQHPIDSFQQHPVQMPLNVLGTVGGVAGMLGKARDVGAMGKAAQAVGESSPNFLQKAGAQGLNSAAGIREGTLRSMAGGENPASAGTKLGQTLYNEKAVGLSPESTFDKSSALKENYGKAVGDSVDAIKQTGILTETNAEQALQPLKDRMAELGSGTLSNTRSLARPYKEIYTKLQSIADGNNGNIGLDDIRSQMDEVGSLLGKTSKTSDKYQAVAELYGKLADIRDGIVKDIASRANNPDLSNNLLKANEGYSRYSRIMPDIAKATAREGVGGNSILSGHYMKAIGEKMHPLFSKAALATGNVAQEIGDMAGGMRKAVSPVARSSILSSQLQDNGSAANNASSIFNKSVGPNTDQNEPNKVAWSVSKPATNDNGFKPADLSIPQHVAKSVPEQAEAKKYLDEQNAHFYLEKAHGDKDLARQMAKRDGWTVS